MPPSSKIVFEDLYELEHGSPPVARTDTNEKDGLATAHDRLEMSQMGLEMSFHRRFMQPAMIGFSCNVVAAWANVLAAFQFALFNGGTGGFFWTLVFSIIAMAFVYPSLAELASAYPTAGGQYQWVVECAPESVGKILSFSIGYLLVLGWQTWLCSCAVIVANLISYCILLYHPDSATIGGLPFRSGLAIIVLLADGLFNLYCTKRFHKVESAMVLLSFVSWLVIVVVLWLTSPRGSPSDVLFTFEDGGNWGSTFTASMVGIITSWGTVLGYDSSVHMSEDAQDASKTIPMALLKAYCINTTMAFVMGTTLIFCAGNIAEVLANTNQGPFVVILHNSTGSKAATVVLTALVTLNLLFASVSQVATASRQLWSFARDGGLPFGETLARTSNAHHPERAVYLTMALSSLLTLVNFFTVEGFNAVVSLAIVAVTASYSICILMLILRRWRGEPLPPRRFDLGRWGIWVNGIAAICAAVVAVLSFFPAYRSPTPATMNWAILMFGAVAVLALVYYIVKGRKDFKPPRRKIA